ncbi:DotA/TraY family protein [Zymobacter sp. IVIA_12111.31 C1]|uniref:DotA/TraY family protein n=1 Tax=Zymobacter sp. IVIA_12111.31 C1 TaxID=3394854 RepID=UPI0039C15CDE
MSDMSSTLSNSNDIFSFNIDNITNDPVGGFKKTLELMFGNWIYGGSDVSLFTEIGSYFNSIAMILISVIASYYVIFNVVKVMQKGSINDTLTYLVMKFLIMSVLLAPIPFNNKTGISVIQYSVVNLAKMGSNIADKLGYKISSNLTQISFDSASASASFDNSRKLLNIAYCNSGLDKNNEQRKSMFYYYKSNVYTNSSSLMSVYDGSGTVQFGLSGGICGSFSANKSDLETTDDIKNVNKGILELNTRYLDRIYNDIIIKSWDYSKDDFENALMQLDKGNNTGSLKVLDNSKNAFLKIINDYNRDYNTKVVNSLNSKASNKESPMIFSIKDGEIVGQMKEDFYKKSGWMYLSSEYKNMSSSFAQKQKISDSFINSLIFANPNGCRDEQGLFAYLFSDGKSCRYDHEFKKAEIIIDETNKLVLQSNSANDVKMSASCNNKNCDKNVLGSSTTDFIRTSFLSASSSDADSSLGRKALSALSWGKGDVFMMNDTNKALDGKSLQFTDAIGTISTMGFRLKSTTYIVDAMLQLSYGGASLVGAIPYVGPAGETLIKYTLDPIRILNSFLATTANVAYISIPLMPVIIFVFAVISYVLIVLEAFICAPIACALGCVDSGETIINQSFQRFLNLIIAVVLRPSLTVVALLISIMMSNWAFTYFNQMYWFVMSDIVSNIDLGGLVFSIIMWFLLSYSILNSCFKIMINFPDNCLEWIAGGLNRKFGNDLDNEMLSSIQQNVSGTAIEKGIVQKAGSIRENRIKKKDESNSSKIRKH